MDAIDANIPEPAREEDKPFLMAIEDVFSIEGRGTVATGRIERGVIKVGEEVEIVGLVGRAARRRPARASRCSASCWTRAGPATTSAACCVASSVTRSSAARSWPSPGRSRRTPSSRPRCTVLSKDEGGRHTPFFSGYRPQFYFRTTDVTGTANLVGARNVHAGRQRAADRGTAQADRDGRRRAVRHSRRRSNGRLGRGDEDPGVRPLARPGLKGCSSIGRAPVSKTGGCEFKSRRPCQSSRIEEVRFLGASVSLATEKCYAKRIRDSRNVICGPPVPIPIPKRPRAVGGIA